MGTSSDVDRMWCRALVEELGEHPDLINKIVTNYNSQRSDGSWGSVHAALSDALVERAGSETNRGER